MKAAVAVFLTMTAPAAAGWKIDAAKDRMTDKNIKTAWVAAVDPASGAKARLEVSCFDDPLVGGLFIQLRTNHRFSQGKMGLSYRVDDGPVENRYMRVTADGMAGWGDARAVLKGKRVRVRLEPFNAKELVFDLFLTDW
jgi:hypothetical protein